MENEQGPLPLTECLQDHFYQLVGLCPQGLEAWNVYLRQRASQAVGEEEMRRRDRLLHRATGPVTKPER